MGFFYEKYLTENQTVKKYLHLFCILVLYLQNIYYFCRAIKQ